MSSSPQIILSGYTREDLLQDIALLVRQEIQSIPKPVHNKTYLSLEEVCELLDLSKQSIYCLTSKKKIPHLKRGGRVLFKRSEILSWVEEGKQPVFK